MHSSRYSGWLVSCFETLAIFQPYRDLEAGDNQSRESKPGPLAPQTKSLTTTPPLLRRHSGIGSIAKAPITIWIGETLSIACY